MSEFPSEVCLLPVPARAVFAEPGWFIWCGSMVRDEAGRCHLYYSRWRREHGFSAWVSRSEVAHARADDPLGPYRHVDIALPRRGEPYWDGHCTHNPTVHRFGGRYYLYYMGNRGAGTGATGWDWTHRNAQRIGVAVADDPGGPWRRLPHPLIEPTPGFHDALCCANPAVTRRPEGGFLMVYKAVGREGELPFGGPVVHLAATAVSPDGPFVKHSGPIFTAEGASFAAEDPFIWHDGQRYRAVVKDMGGHFTGAGVSLARFVSDDGFAWKPEVPALLARLGYTCEDGSYRSLAALERPQVWCDETGQPKVLFCAGADERGGAEGERETFNVAIPLGMQPAGTADGLPARL